jgi:small-conductance mechanosensitive channel
MRDGSIVLRLAEGHSLCFRTSEEVLRKMLMESLRNVAATIEGILDGRRVAALLLDNPVEWARGLWSYVNQRYEVGNFKVSLSSVVIGIAIFLVALSLSRLISAFLQRRIAKRAHIDPGIQYTIVRLVYYAINTIGFLAAFSQAFNADLTTLAVVFTALSVGIGFGLQYIAADIASGFILLFERPVRVGDRVTIGDDEGDVQSINLRTTTVMTNDRIAIIVPNSKLVSQRLINWSYGDPRARISIPIGVASDSDVDLVTKTLMRAAEGVDNVLDDPKPSVQFLKFGDSTLDFRLLVWTNKPRLHAQMRSDINYNIEKLFRENGIEIPFPTQELRIRGGQLRVAPNDGDDLLKHEQEQAKV